MYGDPKSPMDVWIKRFLRVMLFFTLLGVAAFMAHMYMTTPEAKYATETVTKHVRVDSQAGPAYAIGFLLALLASGCVAYWE